MLRVHFTAEDLGRIRLATAADPLWEMVFSRYRLGERDKGVMFRPWARWVRREVDSRAIGPGLRVLTGLAPLGPYFPDFLTPPEGSLGLEPAIDAILGTPRRRLRSELQLLSTAAALPPWASALAEGDQELLADIGHSLRRYHRAAIEPYADTIAAAVEADLAYRSRALLCGGVAGLLDSMRPLMWWRPPVLEIRYDILERDLHLNGRGLVLVPSYFCRRTPVAFADPLLPPTVAYPINHQHTWIYQVAAGQEPDRALAGLLGPTRARVLAAIGGGATTTELADRLRVAASSISRHTTVLREAGVITTRRQGLSVLHTVTPLGSAMLRHRDRDQASKA
ncbi:ArsR/SmtB family transcription factor [Kutzneria sp. NPDC052558]|uniref:ArsR/SmtB family transcription factor n=1 Tax=Kutzneria sp. NPDC052558 TaxID=3364121 RepID=UPI0037CB314D